MTLAAEQPQSPTISDTSMRTRSEDFTGWSMHSKTEKLSGNLEPQANQRFVEFVYPGRLGRKSSTRVDSGSRQT